MTSQPKPLSSSSIFNVSDYNYSEQPVKYSQLAVVANDVAALNTGIVPSSVPSNGAQKIVAYDSATGKYVYSTYQMALLTTASTLAADTTLTTAMSDVGALATRLNVTTSAYTQVEAPTSDQVGYHYAVNSGTIAMTAAVNTVIHTTPALPIGTYAIDARFQIVGVGGSNRFRSVEVSTSSTVFTSGSSYNYSPADSLFPEHTNVSTSVRVTVPGTVFYMLAVASNSTSTSSTGLVAYTIARIA